jgi:hypothetical protein
MAASLRLPERTRFEYRFSLRNGRERHDWSLIGEQGAVDVWAEPSPPGYGDRWFGGIELHFAKRPKHLSARAKHKLCWLLLKPCYHDGSSLAFSEGVAPYLPDPTGKPMVPHKHDVALTRARSWWNSHMVEEAGQP